MTKFHECIDSYDINKKSQKFTFGWEVFYKKAFDLVNPEREYNCLRTPGPKAKSQMKSLGYEVEIEWRSARRPFYHLYPEAFSMLLRTSLDLNVSSLVMPIDCVCVAMPIGCCVIGLGEVTNIFIMKQSGGITFLVRYKTPSEDVPRSISGVLLDNENVKKILSGDGESDGANELWDISARVVVGTMILASQPEMIDRVLLAKDVLYGRTGPSAERRAVKRGINGWSIGKNLEGFGRDVSGHIRRPHFAIRWTGKGGETPRLVPVKGSVVNRSKITTVPTGYLDNPEPPCGSEQ